MKPTSILLERSSLTEWMSSLNISRLQEPTWREKCCGGLITTPPDRPIVSHPILNQPLSCMHFGLCWVRKYSEKPILPWQIDGPGNIPTRGIFSGHLKIFPAGISPGSGEPGIMKHGPSTRELQL